MTVSSSPFQILSTVISVTPYKERSAKILSQAGTSERELYTQLANLQQKLDASVRENANVVGTRCVCGGGGSLSVSPTGG